jgi:DNA modification methylase
MEVKHRKLADLTPDRKNANKGTPRGSQMIEDSFRQYGAGRSILIDKNGLIIAGNKSAEHAGSIGMDDVLVVQTDGTQLVAVQRMDLDLIKDKRAKELAVADNRAGQVSLDWDPAVLQELDIDLDKFWSEDEMKALLASTVMGSDLLTDEDDVPETPEEPVTKTGDLYILGNHRLLCGDATVITDVERLMDGKLADMVFTDPPYGISYQGGTKKRKAIENDQKQGEDLKSFLLTMFSNVCLVSKQGASAYVCHADTERVNFTSAFVEAGFHLSSVIIWVKNNAPFCRQDYFWKHEPILYGWQAGSAHSWHGDHKQDTVWNVDRPSRSEAHPTMKPVLLVEKSLENSSKTGDLVLDLFGGSGTTMIACEKTGRSCCMMELDPGYVDVIVSRWEQAVGKKAVLEKSE